MIVYQIVKILPEHETKKLLLEYSIPTTNFRVLANMGEIENLDMKYPVVLKVSSDKILHKTDAGAIILDIKSKEELISSYKKLKEKFPEETLIVEEMEKKGTEFISGVINDNAFGKCIMVGMGGIFTEIYKDISFRMLPVTEKEIYDMLHDLKVSKIFHGYRIKVDLKALIDILIKVSRIAEDVEIKQLDLNPIFLYERGAKVIDAKAVIGE
ncbi:MAG TPA: acetyl-CoA synthetase [Thermoplasmatales archaeon]|nr:acetyl-CoA synthetase [Thermoplasmatales archaeon]